MVLDEFMCVIPTDCRVAISVGGKVKEENKLVASSYFKFKDTRKIMYGNWKVQKVRPIHENYIYVYIATE